MISLDEYKSTLRHKRGTKNTPGDASNHGTSEPADAPANEAYQESDGADLLPAATDLLPAAADLLPAARAEANATTRDRAERDEMVIRYMPLVYYVVNTLNFSLPPMLDTEDLVGYGMMGLINAIDRFDEVRGVKFETYAVTRVRGYIIDQLRSLDWVPRSTRQRARQIRRASEEMEHTLGRTPTANEVATQLGLDRDKYDYAVQSGSSVTLSLDALVHPDAEEGQSALLQTVADESSPDPSASLEARDLTQAITSALHTLSEREQQLLRLYYFEGHTLRDISRVLSVSESRACQIHARALKRLRVVIAA